MTTKMSSEITSGRLKSQRIRKITSVLKYRKNMDSDGKYIHTHVLTYIHKFHGSISVSKRQQDVEQVINTQIWGNRDKSSFDLPTIRGKVQTETEYKMKKRWKFYLLGSMLQKRRHCSRRFFQVTDRIVILCNILKNMNWCSIYIKVRWQRCTVIPRLTSDPANEFFG